MRCEECLAVVEEFFDGELGRQKGEQVSAHMAACEDCAAALDALAFEQEMYLRYDRGLEVTPALWQNVRAGVARLDEAEKAARPLPPLERLRERLGAAFAAFVPRAAFAPALALVLLAAAAGALWLARRPGPAPEVARQQPAAANVGEGRPPQVVQSPGDPVETGGPEFVEPDRVEAVQPATAGPERGGLRIVKAGGANTPAPGRTSSDGHVAAAAPLAANHLEAFEAEGLPSTTPAPSEGGDVLVASAGVRLPTPEEKEMTRHLEQAQMLLRAFQNEAAAGSDAVQITYERRLSRKLLAENATLQLEAEAAGNKQTRQVLDTLEPFLLDIANLRDNASRDEVRSIKERMQKKEIIAALHVY